MAGLLDSIFNTQEGRMGLGLLALGQAPRSQAMPGLLSLMANENAMKQQEMQRQVMQSQIAENASQAKLREQQAAKSAQLQDFLSSKFSAGNDARQYSAGQSALAAGSEAGDIGPTFGNAQRQGMAMAQQPQSGFPLSFNEVVQLQAMGGPNLMEAFKLSQEGIKQEAGQYYRNPSTGQISYMPKLDNGMAMSGNQVVAAPGYAQANASIKGAEAGAVEGAKYPYTVGADRAKQITQSQLDLVPQLDADGNTIQVPRYNVATGQGAGGGISARNPVTQSAASGLNDNWIKNSYQTTLDAGKAAGDIASSLQAIRNIDLNTGWGAEAKATAANVLTGLGIAPQNATMFATNAQKFQSVAMDRLMTTLAAQKGPQTEGDASRASQTFAQLKNTPEANKFIIDFAQAKANQDMRKAQFYEQALPLAQKTGDLTRIDREWRKIQGSIWNDPVLQQWSK